MTRHGSVIHLREDRKADYIALHAAVWPDVLRAITAASMRNYTIFLKEPENLLFSYFEYVGSDFDGDMARMAADPVTQAWWAICKPCHQPLETRKPGEWWADMAPVFHQD
jgi:L-rhamnose mutarotase